MHGYIWRPIYVALDMANQRQQRGEAQSDEYRWVGLALSLLELCPQTDEVLRQRHGLLSELVSLSKGKAK